MERTILQTFKNKNLKSFWNNYKTFLTNLIKEDRSVLLIVINFIYKSWPSKLPDKICTIIEFYELLVSIYQSELIKLPNFKKITSKIISSTMDLNILVADKSLIIFKNDTLLKMFINDFKFGNKILLNLIDNIKNHWCDDIKSISKLVLSKIKSSYPDSIEELDNDSKNYISLIQFSQATDELWELLRFELKAD